MITNERQYKITRSQADRFKKALTEFSLQTREGVHPRLVQAEREALESQISDLELELANFDSLKSQNLAMISLDSFDGLAEGLIKARIASGLSQRDLADRLGLKEQQIQRYEADRYGSASLQRVQEIAQAIGVRIQNEIMLPIPAVSFDSLVAKLRQVGLDRDFVLTRLLPSSDLARLSGEADVEDQSQILQRTGEILQRIFGWTRENLFGPSVLQSPQLAAAHARFKMPANRSQKTTTAYTAYAHYLALTVLRSCADLPRRPIPLDPTVFRQAVIDAYGEFELRSALHYAWDLGVPVLPLRDRGTFHGACWRYNHRNIVVLKQTSAFEARWLFDLLHELFHAGQEPEAATLGIIEGDETSAERRSSDEEIAASQFAGDASLDGQAEELAQACVEAARGSVQRLKVVVPQIAEEYDVSVGALANYMAFRLSWQGVSWWGAAANLQTGDADPWRIARDVFLERFPARFESEIDRNLLERVLHRGIPMTEFKKPEPLKITCTAVDCENDLHCFKQLKKMTSEQRGKCRACEADLVDWSRLKQRDLTDAAHTFEALQHELIRHHFFHKEIDEGADRHARRKGRLALFEAVETRLTKHLAPAEPPRDGYQTPLSGNAIYYAQHATATCCRTCLEYWHAIPKGRSLTAEELGYCQALIELFLNKRLPGLSESPTKVPARRHGAGEAAALL